MNTPKRVIVDGIETGRILQFVRLLGSISAAMQPPRLVVGLLMIVLLLCGGGLWDALRPATISPKGLAGPEWTVDDAKRANALLRRMLNEYDVPEEERPEGWQEANLVASSDEVIDLISAQYRKDRREREESGNTASIAAADRNFRADLQSIRDAVPLETFDASKEFLVRSAQKIIEGVGSLKIADVFAGFGNLFVDLPRLLWTRDWSFVVIFGTFLAAVISLGGGALARMAACEFSSREKIRVSDGIDFAVRRWPTFLGAQLLPILLAMGLGLVIVCLGVLMNVPLLDVIGGLLYGVALLVGLLIAFLLLGYAAGFPMLIPAVACENCDAGDALTRSYAYLLSRPFQLAWYLLVSLVGGSLGYIVVAGVALVALNLTAAFFGMATNSSALAVAGGFDSLFSLGQTLPPPIHATWHSEAAAWCLTLWQAILIGLVGSYVLAYIFDSFTRVYLLMRLAADGQGTQEIWRPRMIPATAVPVPAPTPEATPPTPHAGRRLPDLIAAIMRGIAAMRLGAPIRLRPVAAPEPEQTKADDLGPELIPIDDRRVAGVEPPDSAR